jgi:HD domain
MSPKTKDISTPVLPTWTPHCRSEAIALLQHLAAPAHLLRHVELVAEAGDALILALQKCAVEIDSQFVQVGVVLHDVGKIAHPNELFEPGNHHETIGEQMLLNAGVTPAMARVSLSHARWAALPVSLEELLIALSDKLWKGVRVTELETRVITEAAARSKREYWTLFMALDGCFEDIADAGAERLARSHVAGA